MSNNPASGVETVEDVAGGAAVDAWAGIEVGPVDVGVARASVEGASFSIFCFQLACVLLKSGLFSLFISVVLFERSDGKTRDMN